MSSSLSIRNRSVGDHDVSETISDGSQLARVRARRRAISYFVLPLGALVVILGLWEIVAQFMNPLLVSSPQATASAIGTILSQSSSLSSIGASLKEMYIGLGLGVVIGFVLGVFVGRFPGVNNVASPFINVVNATPLIVMIPLLIIWTGIGTEARIIFNMLVTVFPMLLNTMAGVRNTPKGYVEVAASLGLSERRTLWKVAIPAAVPYMLAGLRSSLSLAIIAMVIGEMEISSIGVGWLLLQYGDGAQTGFLLGLICITSVIGVINVTFLKVIDRTFFKWTTLTR